MERSASDYPMLSAAMAMMPETAFAAGSARLTKAPKRVRASLPPPSAFTPLSDPPAESPPPPLPQGLPSIVANRTSWQGPISAAGMPARGVLGKGLMGAPRDRSRSEADAGINSEPKQADLGQEINLPTSFADKDSTGLLLDDGIQARRGSERSLDSRSQAIAENEGDAARHANLIMETRRAKIQKWRPASAETQKGVFGLEPLKKSVAPRLARTLSEPRLEGSHPIQSESLSAWDFENHPSSANQQDASMILLEHSQDSPMASPSGLPISSRDGLSLQVPGAVTDGKGAAAMEKLPSSGSNVNGIEWVDWLDEYKKYKEAKIRSEEEMSLSAPPWTAQSSHGAQRLALQTTMPVQSSSHETREGSGTSISSQHSPLSPKQTTSLLTPELETTCKPPHIARMQEAPGTKLSRALSQTGDILHRTVSRTDSRRPHPSVSSNALNASLRQSSQSHKGTSKKAKGLGNKIEGWWHSVKTNFQNPVPTNPPVPKILPFPPRSVDASGRQQPSRTKTTATKVPSAPPSRRGSVMPLQSDLTAQPTTFGEEMNQQAHALRTATSHTDLARLGDDITSAQAAEDDRQGSVSPISVPTMHHRQASDPSDSATRGSLAQHFIPVQRAATGLEARRKQPALSLKLDSQMLALPHQTRRQYSGTSMVPTASGLSSSTGSRGPASYSGQESSAGMASGLRAWDQTPSPLQALNVKPAQDISVKTSPRGGTAEFNKVSVQQHVKHRLTVAKENCDRELQAIICEITAYVEQHIQRERQLVSDIPLEEEEDPESSHSVQRPFDHVSSTGSEGLPTSLELETGSMSLSRGMSPSRFFCVAPHEADSLH